MEGGGRNSSEFLTEDIHCTCVKISQMCLSLLYIVYYYEANLFLSKEFAICLRLPNQVTRA